MNFSPLRLFPVFALVVFALVSTPALLSQAPAASLTLLSRDGRRTIPLTVNGDTELVGLDDLAAAFQLAVQESLGAITVGYKGKTIILTPDQSLASVAGRLISLPAAPVRNGRRWLVPVEFVGRALAPVYDAKIELRKPSRLVLIGDVRVPRIAIRYDGLGATARVTIDATPRASSTVSQDNDHIFVKFDADALDTPTPLFTTPPAPALVQGIRLSDPLTIDVDLPPHFGGFKATSQPIDNTTRLVLDLNAPTETATPPPGTPSTTPAAPPELPPAFGQTAPAIRSIAIDPGHGGEDDGVRGPNGVKEKALVLAVARRVKAALEARLGIRVLLTRDDDRNVAIDERTAIANNNKADLFISLHANASMQPAAAGATIYRAAFDGATTGTASGHSGERVPAFGGGLRDVEMVPWDLAQTRHLTQSSAFADLLLPLLRDRIPLSPAPSSQAPLRVLESANMPAVLIELGYLSNPAQEKMLTGDTFQGGFVQAVYDAIVKYRDTLQGAGGGAH